jgi:hypothetical protein
MSRAAKRHLPKYVTFAHQGVDYVIDLNNREVLRNWVCIERQAMPSVIAAYQTANPQALSA